MRSWADRLVVKPCIDAFRDVLLHYDYRVEQVRIQDEAQFGVAL